MSADNGIYILVTPTNNGGEEYRVVHAMAIDNLDYDVPEGWDLNPEEVKNYFENTPVFGDEKEALDYAHELAKDWPFLEYGISSIKAERKFSEYAGYKGN